MNEDGEKGKKKKIEKRPNQLMLRTAPICLRLRSCDLGKTMKPNLPGSIMKDLCFR